MRCASCGHEFSGSFQTACPACGVVAQDPFNPASSPPPPTPWAPPHAQGTEPREEIDGGIPWEVEQSATNLFETMKLVLLETSQTFRTAGVVKSIGPAFFYCMILGVVGGVLGMLWQFGVSGDWMNQFVPAEYHETLDGAFGPSMGDIIAIPMGVAIGVFINAALHHVALMMVGAATKGFEGTFRAVAFVTGSVALFQIVPGLGHMVQLIWAIVATTIGFREIHQTTTGKAIFGALFPWLICCFCLGSIGAVAVSALGSLESILD